MATDAFKRSHEIYTYLFDFSNISIFQSPSNDYLIPTPSTEVVCNTPGNYAPADISITSSTINTAKTGVKVVIGGGLDSGQYTIRCWCPTFFGAVSEGVLVLSIDNN